MSLLTIYGWGCFVVGLPVSLTSLLFRLPSRTAAVVMILTWPVGAAVLLAMVIRFTLKHLFQYRADQIKKLISQ